MESFKFKTERRNKLYFNKFKYRAVIRIVGVQYTYYTPNIEAFCNRIEKFKESETFTRTQKMFSLHDRANYWNDINYDNIEKYMIFRDTMSKDKILSRISGDTVSFFSNDINSFSYLQTLDPNMHVTEAQVLDDNKLYFKKKPRYKYRTYFRAKRMPQDFSENVLNLKSTYSTDILRFSPGLLRSLFYKSQYNPYRYMHGSHFVEYNNEQMHTILAMWFPDMLAKTYTLAKEL